MRNVTRGLIAGLLLAFATGCSTPGEYLRVGTSLEQVDAEYRACREAVAEGVYVPPVTPSGALAGTPAGAAAGGAAAGFSESVQEYRLTQQCMRERGYRRVKLTPEDLKALEAAPAEERDRLIGELLAQQDRGAFRTHEA